MERNRKPNLVWILSDQHRFCDTGFAGNEDVETPHLDRLAGEGAEFTAAYSSCPLCVPARGTILTGLHSLNHGAVANDMPIRPDCESIASVLNRAGYHTAYIGKWHLGGTPRDAFIPHYNRLQFQYWRANNCNHNYFQGYYDDESNIRHKIDGYAPIGETELALEYLNEYGGKEKPFAMFLNYSIPHDPYFLLPIGDLERYISRSLTLRRNCLRSVLSGEACMTEYDPERYYAGYYAHIRQLDVQIGRVVERLKEMGEYENTIILYTSDHGDMLGSHGYLNKQIYFDESARIPLVISWPGHIPQGKRKTAIGLVDIAPTVLGLLGLKFDGKVDGEDLSEVALRPEEDRDRFVYFYSYVPCHQAVNRKIGSWRAISNGKIMLASDQKRNIVALYDMSRDAFQMHDCREEREYQGIKKELLQELDKEVLQYDGYEDWQKLLEDRELCGPWEESEKFFAVFFRDFFKKTCQKTE